MKKYILVLLILFAAAAPFFIFRDRTPPLTQTAKGRGELRRSIDLSACQENLLNYLKSRKDKPALIEAEKILSVEPGDSCALWGKAEILRRAYKFKQSEDILKEILGKSPNHASSLISLSYIRYHNKKFKAALEILKQVLGQPDLDRENKALAYMLMGSINARKSSLGGLFCKIVYGTRVKGYFQKAKKLAPDLSEVRLGLGSFYLLAPAIAGGDVDQAIKELEYAVKLAPDFATANARLAQAYKKKGNLKKYNFYIQRVRKLDPENEVLKELQNEELRD